MRGIGKRVQNMQKIGKFGLIGCGNMGSALVRGVVNAHLLEPYRIRLVDVDAKKARALAEETGAIMFESNLELFGPCPTIILAVKPQGIAALLDEIAPVVTGAYLLISVAAGIPLRMIENRLGREARVIRVMPNTPATIGCGAAAVARGSAVDDSDVETALAIFRAVGIAVEVEESQMDAVTGLSGSGPAYVFRMIEALARAGEKAGLPAEVAALLARQTVLGAARMAAETGEEPAELRRRVTSPKGTTEAGLQTLEAGGFEGLLERVVARAAERSKELARLFE